MKATVLIVEDEVEIAELIKLYLAKEGIDSIHTESAEDGIAVCKEKNIDLVVLDINLPGMDGFEFLIDFRKKKNIPVIIVSARDADEDMILGLGIGADDFVRKPFSPKLLVARIRANLRRHLDTGYQTRRVQKFGPFSLDSDGYYLEKEGERITMATRELEVLCLLVDNAGSCLSPEQIYHDVWKNDYGDITTVAVHIQRIRKKIGDAKEHKYIATVHGQGYRFNPDVLTG